MSETQAEIAGQGSLFDVERKTLPPFQRHSATSREAAISMYEHAATQRAAVFRAFMAAEPHGLTDEEISQRLGLKQQSATPRRIELVREGAVVASGQFRYTTSGRRATVWVVRPTGPEAGQEGTV